MGRATRPIALRNGLRTLVHRLDRVLWSTPACQPTHVLSSAAMSARLSLIAVLPLLLSAGCKNDAPPESPVDFGVPELGFAVQLPPGSPYPELATDEKQKTAIGPIHISVYRSNSERGAAVVAANRLPDRVFLGPVARRLQAGMQAQVKEVNGTLMSDTAILHRETPGHRFTYRFEGSGRTLFARTELFFRAPFQYQVQYLAPEKARLSAPDVDAFFASFEMLPADAVPQK